MKHTLHSIYASNCLTCIIVGSAAGETGLLLLLLLLLQQAAPLISLMAQAQAVSPSRPLPSPMTHSHTRLCPPLPTTPCPSTTTAFLRNQARRVRIDDSDMLNVRDIHPACAHTHAHNVMPAMTPTRPSPIYPPLVLPCPRHFCFVAPHYCRVLY